MKKDEKVKEVSFEEKVPNKKKKSIKEKKKEIKKENNNSKIDINIEKKEIKKTDDHSDEKATIGSFIELILIIIFVIVVLVFFPHSVIWNIVVLLLMLSVLIFVHEFGHFIMAKKFNVYVYEFAIGMGPLVLSFRRKGDPTLYSLRALPIGGYNQLAGESYEDDDTIPKDMQLCNKPKYQRLIILVAGVCMNLILAFVLLFFISLCAGSRDTSTYITDVIPDSPAYEAGIRSGDSVISIEGYRTYTWNDMTVSLTINQKKGSYSYKIKRTDGSEFTTVITPSKYLIYNDNYYKITDENTEEKIVSENNIPEGEYTVSDLIGISANSEIKHGFVNALSYAGSTFICLIRTMYACLYGLVTGKLGLDSLSGPVGMYKIVDQASAFGFANIIYLTAYLSINLAVINILPFPAFDGGHVLFIIIELITGHRVNERVENAFHTIGFVLLMILILLVTWHDITTLIG